MAIRNGRLRRSLNEAFKRVNQSIQFDWKLYREDILGSVAYARALAKRGIITGDELRDIVDGLREIEREIQGDKFRFREEDEDIHMNIERRLSEIIGPPAQKLHTGRSRNEQIVLDERLYIMGVLKKINEKLEGLFYALIQKAKLCLSTIIPSYTHLRQAQVVSLAHIFLAYYHALRREKERFSDYEKRLKILPLGSGAVAGSAIGIDRDFLRDELGFSSLSRNSIDAISTRDFIGEFEFICASLMVAFSRIAEDIILFSTEEFGYYSLPDELTTTSSLMPHKKNPDSLELIRGKAGRVVGNLVSFFTMMKGLPYTYNRDMQEDKEALFDTAETTINVAELMTEVVKGLVINYERINKALDQSKGMLFATDLADYLVEKGVPFRKAHQVVGRIVRYAEQKNISFQLIPIREYRRFCPDFDEDVYKVFDYLRSVNRHDVEGGTALKRVAEEITRIEEELRR
ncbi:MAG: argininosuccinate lyase [Spirochaetota bacterium]